MAIFWAAWLQTIAAEEAMVFTSKAKIYAAPGKKSFQLKILTTAEKGAEALLIDETNIEAEKWYKVKLADNVVGWAEAKFLESKLPKALSKPEAEAAEEGKGPPSSGPASARDAEAKQTKVSLPRGGYSALERYTLKAPLLEADVEEELISIDTKDPLYSPYFGKLTSAIQNSTIYPADAYRAQIEGRVFLRFTLLRNGELAGINVTNSSGFKILDDAATDAVQLASPFEPFPEPIKKAKLNISIDFIFKPIYPKEEEKTAPTREEEGLEKPLFRRSFR